MNSCDPNNNNNDNDNDDNDDDDDDDDDDEPVYCSNKQRKASAKAPCV